MVVTHKWAYLSAGAILLLGGMGHARADLIFHNGTSLTGTADVGSGDVDVSLAAASDFSFVQKFFGSNFVSGSQEHILQYEFNTDQPPVNVLQEVVQNNTTDVWTGFIIDLQADFFREDPEGGDPIPLDVGTISFSDVGFTTFGIGSFNEADASISFTRDNLFTELQLSFGGSGFAPGDVFGLSYIIGLLPGAPDFGFNGFTMEEIPLVGTAVIPAPGAACLGLLGLCCVGWVRRRHGSPLRR